MELIEKVARALAQAKGIEICSDASYAMSSFREPALAAIRAMLDGVESNLSAVQYDPAPYTAMKHRIAAMRKDVE